MPSSKDGDDRYNPACQLHKQPSQVHAGQAISSMGLIAITFADYPLAYRGFLQE